MPSRDVHALTPGPVCSLTGPSRRGGSRVGVGEVPKETRCDLKTEGGTKSEPRQAVVSRSRKGRNGVSPGASPRSTVNPHWASDLQSCETVCVV